jgi:hypothetical protein
MFGSLLGGAGGGLGGAAAGGPDMMSFFNNPSLMNMVCFVLFFEKSSVTNPEIWRSEQISHRRYCISRGRRGRFPLEMYHLL